LDADARDKLELIGFMGTSLNVGVAAKIECKTDAALNGHCEIVPGSLIFGCFYVLLARQ